MASTRLSPLQVALTVAVRHIDAGTTNDTEKEAILTAFVKHMPDSAEAEAASRSLHYHRLAKDFQLQLRGLIEGRA